MGKPRIEAYEFGRMVIDGRQYTKDLIIAPATGGGSYEVLDGWWRDEGHLLKPGDLDAVLQSDADLLIVGQGAQGRMQVTEETKDALARSGIDLEALDTAAAVERYGAVPEQNAVAAAFHLTC